MSVARIAIQFHLGEISSTGTDAAAGWYATGKSPFAPEVNWRGQRRNDDGELEDDNTNRLIPENAWGEAREVRLGADRDYGGINSSGGPQQSGRADHRLIVVERNSDKISPRLFMRCCNGMQLKRVVIHDPNYRFNASDPMEAGLWIVAEDTHVTSFEFIVDKDLATRHNVESVGVDAGSEYFAVSSGARQSLGSTRRYERITILYTKIAMQVGNSGYLGWDTGTETKWVDPRVG